MAPPQQVDGLLAKYDVDANGVVDFQEFAAMMVRSSCRDARRIAFASEHAFMCTDGKPQICLRIVATVFLWHSKRF